MPWAVTRAPTPPLRNACAICAAQNGGMAAASLARTLPGVSKGNPLRTHNTKLRAQVFACGTRALAVPWHGG
eukprot:1964588-Prymnesium_polylepis.1